MTEAKVRIDASGLPTRETREVEEALDRIHTERLKIQLGLRNSSSEVCMGTDEGDFPVLTQQDVQDLAVLDAAKTHLRGTRAHRECGRIYENRGVFTEGR